MARMGLWLIGWNVFCGFIVLGDKYVGEERRREFIVTCGIWSLGGSRALCG